MLRLLILASTLGLLLQAAGASAEGFTVSPVRVELNDKRNNTALSVTNAGEVEVVIQSELVRWTQVDGKDVYEKSDALIVNPPIFKVKPKTTQVVRIGMRKAAEAGGEQAYRVFLTELPGATQPGEQGLKLTLRVGIPIFVRPAGNVAPAMQWKVARPAGDSLAVEMKNTGNAHVQVKSLRLTGTGDSSPMVDKTMSNYVFPGQMAQWKFPIALTWKGTSVHLSARTDAENVEMDIPLQAR